jgi:hypothetical protein
MQTIFHEHSRRAYLLTAAYCIIHFLHSLDDDYCTFVDMFSTLPMGSSCSKLHVNMVLQKLASTHFKVHERILHVKFKVVFCCGRLFFLKKTILKVMGRLQNSLMIEREKLPMPLFSGFFSEVTKLVMYFIVAVVLGTIAESQKLPI